MIAACIRSSFSARSPWRVALKTQPHSPKNISKWIWSSFDLGTVNDPKCSDMKDCYLQTKQGAEKQFALKLPETSCHFWNPPPLRIGFTYTFHQNVPGNGSHGIQMIRSKASLHTMGTLSQPGCLINKTSLPGCQISCQNIKPWFFTSKWDLKFQHAAVT